MSDVPRVLLVGASGLIGQEVISLYTGREDLHLIALVRREMKLPKGLRIEVLVADPAEWTQAVHTIAPDKVLCALGTTIAQQGGDQEAFAAVDRDLVLQVARAAKDAGATSFTVVSSVGADPRSKNFYLRTKGEMEDALRKLRFPRLDVLRPGLLKGDRREGGRPLEKLGRIASPVTDLFLQGERRKYRSIAARDVAQAMLRTTREKARGQFAHTRDGIMLLVGRN